MVCLLCQYVFIVLFSNMFSPEIFYFVIHFTLWDNVFSDPIIDYFFIMINLFIYAMVYAI